jgi:hypothetical protein
MAEFHKRYSITGGQDVLWQIYNFVNDQKTALGGSAVIDFAQSAGKDVIFIDTGETEAQIGKEHRGTFQSHATYADIYVILDADLASSSSNYYNSPENYTIKVTGSGLFSGETSAVTAYSGSLRRATTSWTPQTMTGTHTLNATTAVVGSGTSYTTEVAVGDLITINGEQKEIATITDNLNLTVTSAFAGSGGFSGTLDHPSSQETYDIYYGPAGFSTPTSADAFGEGSYIVVEYQFNYPSGSRKWQVQIIRDFIGKSTPVSTTGMRVRASPNGGFTIAAETSGSLDADFGSEPTTGQRLWHDTTAVFAADDQLYLSVSDNETYDGGTKKYGYLRCFHYDASADASDSAFYVGGYIPFDIANNTEPFVLLAGRPQISDATNSGANNFWGNFYLQTVLITGQQGRAPLEDGQCVTDMDANGFAALMGSSQITESSNSQTRSGQEVECMLYIIAIGTRRALGYVGENTMTGISSNVNNLQAKSGSTRINVNNIMMHWNP